MVARRLDQDLQIVRSEIDAVDRELVRCLARRRRLVDRAARIKKHPRFVADPDRNETVLANVRAAALEFGVPQQFVDRIWRHMIELWIRYQVELLTTPDNENQVADDFRELERRTHKNG